MSNSISITVPAHDAKAVRAAAVFFAALADIKTMVPADLDAYRPSPQDVVDKMCACQAAQEPSDSEYYKQQARILKEADEDTIVYHTAVPDEIPGNDDYPVETDNTEFGRPPVDAGAAFGVHPAVDQTAPVYVNPTTLTMADVNTSQVLPDPTVGRSLQELLAPPAPTPTVVSGVKLDSEGLPWDRRINASTKTLRQSDGTWKLIRGVADSLVAKVKDELRLAMGQTAVPPVTPPASVVPAPPGGTGFADPATNPSATPLPPPPTGLPNMDGPDDGFGPATPPAPPVPPAPTLTVVPPLPPAAPAPPAPPADDPFPEFVLFCTSSQQSGKLEYQQIVSTCGKYGITQLPMLNARHDLIPTIRAELEALCKP